MCSERCTVIKNPAICLLCSGNMTASQLMSQRSVPGGSQSTAKLLKDEVDRLIVRNTYQHTHTHTHTFSGPLSGTTRVSRYQKGKTNLDFTETRDISSGISWAMCKSAPRSRQITTPAPHYSSFFTGRMPFLPPNQQCQSTEGRALNKA